MISPDQGLYLGNRPIGCLCRRKRIIYGRMAERTGYAHSVEVINTFCIQTHLSFDPDHSIQTEQDQCGLRICQINFSVLNCSDHFGRKGSSIHFQTNTQSRNRSTAASTTSFMCSTSVQNVSSPKVSYLNTFLPSATKAISNGGKFKSLHPHQSDDLNHHCCSLPDTGLQ